MCKKTLLKKKQDIYDFISITACKFLYISDWCDMYLAYDGIGQDFSQTECGLELFFCIGQASARGELNTKQIIIAVL